MVLPDCLLFHEVEQATRRITVDNVPFLWSDHVTNLTTSLTILGWVVDLEVGINQIRVLLEEVIYLIDVILIVVLASNTLLPCIFVVALDLEAKGACYCLT